ncbi:MAG: hypothetical protein V4629_06520 [Pseudomonadota bacterium]
MKPFTKKQIEQRIKHVSEMLQDTIEINKRLIEKKSMSRLQIQKALSPEGLSTSFLEQVNCSLY